jgi:hypothetical protein
VAHQEQAPGGEVDMEDAPGRRLRADRHAARGPGTAPEYREWCDRVAAGGYRELELA